MRDLQVQEFEEAIEDFRTYLNAYNYANARSYVYCVLEMLEWMEQKGLGAIIEIRVANIKQYFSYLMKRPSKLGGYLGESHLKNNGFSVELFFRMLLENGKVEKGVRVPRKILKGKWKERASVTMEELKKLYETTETPIERAIISLAYGCGLRRSEIARLNLADIRFTRHEIHIIRGKGEKYRVQLMNEKVEKDIKEYIMDQRSQLLKKKGSRENALFINRIGYRMSGDSLNEKVKNVVARTKDPALIEKSITLHCLRHSIAMHFVEKGVGMEFIQRFLGHSEIDTSQIYAQKRLINKNRGL